MARQLKALPDSARELKQGEENSLPDGRKYSCCDQLRIVRSGPQCPQRRNVCVGAGKGRLSKFLLWSGRLARPSFATRCFELASWISITNNLGRRCHELTAAEKLGRSYDGMLSYRPLHQIVADSVLPFWAPTRPQAVVAQCCEASMSEAM